LGPLGEAARALLLDVEGTTTPIAFVHETLFPYARARLAGFLGRHARDEAVLADVETLRLEHAAERSAGHEPPAWQESASLDAAARYALWLMDRDRKSTGLKSLQGRVWEEGFASGELRGAVYDDVPRAFERWRRQGRTIAIFSSGSVRAQKLLFRHSSCGDLTGSIGAYFDTTTGAKREAESYRRIAAALGEAPARVLFVSDVADELEAAAEAGLLTALCVRGGGAPAASAHPMLRGFDGINP
jgi:enolase-phosphatase E1